MTSSSSASTLPAPAPPSASPSPSTALPSDFHPSFSSFGVLLERESDEVDAISKLVRDLHRINRSVSSSLQSIHTTACTSDAALAAVAASAQAELLTSTSVYQSISSVLRSSSSPAYKLHGVWQFALQQSIFLLSLCHFLQQRNLLPLPSVAALLQLDLVTCDIDDYLTGLTFISKELTRLAINAVRTGNPALVPAISSFLHHLYAGYRLLNLRNDGLRRKVDGLKYDVLKVEEILYDMAVRKAKGGGGGGGTEAGSGGEVEGGVQVGSSTSTDVTPPVAAANMKD